jgi:hypothetical protein
MPAASFSLPAASFFLCDVSIIKNARQVTQSRVSQ